MIRFRTIILFLFISLPVFSQPGTWTWMKGGNTVNSPGNFGTQGVAVATNTPPGLYEACEWTDLTGKFWLFGGTDAPANQFFGDLWMFDPATNNWTWVKGPNTPNTAGVYGVQGVPAPANNPGNRGWGMCTWVDNAGDLWMFGGNGYDAMGNAGFLSDLWKYNIASNQWTWVSGVNIRNSAGVYGTVAVAAPANYPPARGETSACWKDARGDLWLFGGLGSQGGLQVTYNDLWKYNIASNQWTWMKGPNTVNGIGSYGTVGVAAATNNPPSKWIYARWVDLNSNLWMAQGLAIKGVPGNLSALWKYDIATNNWTWMKGASTVNSPGSIGTQCVAAASNFPPSRFENKAAWTDSCGNFWMFGGLSNSVFANDLWHYNVQNNEWTMVQNNGTGNYGAVTVPAATNKPPGRIGALPFKDNNNNLWVFGGESGNGCLNDLWKFVIDTNCVGGCNFVQSVTANFTSNVQNGCPSLTVNFTNTSSIIANSWDWNFGDGNSDSIANPTNTYTNPGTYTVTLIASNGSVNDTVTNTITVHATAVAAYTTSNDTVCLGQSVTFNNTSTNSNGASWNFGDSNTSPATSPTHTYGANGNYTVTLIAQNANGCHDTITSNVFVTGATVTPGNPLTLGCITPSGTISATSATPNATYVWTGPGIVSGDSTASPTVNVPGTYTVIVTDPITGCTNSTTVIVINSPISFANVSPDVSILLGANTTLIASGGGTYNWFPSGGLSDSTNNITVASPIVTTTYCVEVIDTNGCKDTACVTVSIETPCPNAEILDVPNAFSPNEDGINDEFCLLGWDTCIEYFQISIYSRWGEKVFESRDPDFCWDGKYNKTTMDAQVLVYYLEARFTNTPEKAIKNGNISLIR